MPDQSPPTSRRGFIRSSAALAGGSLLATASAATAEEKGAQKKADDKGTTGDKPAKGRPIKHLLLFMHPPVTYSYNRLLKPATTVDANWKKELAKQGADKSTAVCIVHSGHRDQPLEDVAKEHFGDRCIVNPSDNSTATRVLLAGDLDRTFGGRGNHGEWNPYELWSSNNARRWVEGLKVQLKKRGYAYDPGTLTMETFGSWSGCHHKYSNFMATYLGMKQPAQIHAEIELCSLKSMPMIATEFVELKAMPRNTWLAVFRRADGKPMAQFWDGLRPVWAPPHTATVKMNPGKVELINFSPNSLIPVSGHCTKLKDGFIMDVGDGTHPAFTTVLTRSDSEAAFKELTAALSKAVIAPRDDRLQVSVAVET